MLLREAIAEANKQLDEKPSLPGADDYHAGFNHGVRWVLGLLAECDDIEDEGLEDYV